MICWIYFCTWPEWNILPLSISFRWINSNFFFCLASAQHFEIRSWNETKLQGTPFILYTFLTIFIKADKEISHVHRFAWEMCTPGKSISGIVMNKLEIKIYLEIRLIILLITTKKTFVQHFQQARDKQSSLDANGQSVRSKREEKNWEFSLERATVMLRISIIS